MSTLDDITKEKQRLNEELARVDVFVNLAAADSPVLRELRDREVRNFVASQNPHSFSSRRSTHFTPSQAAPPESATGTSCACADTEGHTGS